MSGPDAAYAAFLAEGRLRLQRCEGCKRHIFYPRVLCPHCGSDSLNWVDASGRGTVYATTVVRKRPEEGGGHNLCLIDLEEGVRMASRVEGIAPEEVAIGMAVTARIAQQGEDAIVVFDLS
jgi:uncharacterized protein